MKKFSLMLVFGCVLLASCSISGGEIGKSSKASKTSNSGAIAWVYSLDEGMSKAASEKKPVMIDIYAEWCYYCKKLDAQVYSDKEISDIAAKFVCVKIDGDKQPQIARRFEVQGYPTIIFLASNGSIIDKVVGYEEKESFKERMQQVLAQ